MCTAAIGWSKKLGNDQLPPDQWWNVVPEVVRGWIVEGNYASIVNTLEERAQTWREKRRKMVEKGKSGHKYRLLLTRADTADMYRHQITV